MYGHTIAKTMTISKRRKQRTLRIKNGSRDFLETSKRAKSASRYRRGWWLDCNFSEFLLRSTESVLSASTGVEAVPPLSCPLFFSTSSFSSSGMGIFVSWSIIFLLLLAWLRARSFRSSAARMFANLSLTGDPFVMILLPLLLSCIVYVDNGRKYVVCGDGGGDEVLANLRILIRSLRSSWMK